VPQFVITVCSLYLGRMYCANVCTTILRRETRSELIISSDLLGLTECIYLLTDNVLLTRRRHSQIDHFLPSIAIERLLLTMVSAALVIYL
jgi:hypothetical protein